MSADYLPEAEVVDLCQELIRIDTSNFGSDAGPGEREAAERVAELLDDVGIASELFEPEPAAPWWRTGRPTGRHVPVAAAHSRAS